MRNGDGGGGGGEREEDEWWRRRKEERGKRNRAETKERRTKRTATSPFITTATGIVPEKCQLAVRKIIHLTESALTLHSGREVGYAAERHIYNRELCMYLYQCM
jgi:hypothetical protein